MRQTQTELLKASTTEVEMHVTESGFYHRAVTVGAVIAALARLKGRAPWRRVTLIAGSALDYPAEALAVFCKGENRTTWERECSFAMDLLVKQGVCLPYETSGRGIWQFAQNIASETPDYSKLK